MKLPYSMLEFLKNEDISDSLITEMERFRANFSVESVYAILTRCRDYFEWD